MKKEFSRPDTFEGPAMVDVSVKDMARRAAATPSLTILDEEVISKLESDEIHTKKGPVFQTAILTGIMVAKKTSGLVPLCHPLGLDHCIVDVSINEKKEVGIFCTTKVSAKTGAGTEALTGTSVTASTIYPGSCKGFPHNIEIRKTKSMEKKGGKSDFSRA